MRRFLLIALAIVAVAGLALAASPWWQAGVLRLGLRRAHFAFGGYERVGYARFRLRDVTGAGATWKFTAQSVEAPTLPAWLVQRWRHQSPAASVNGWTVAIQPAPATPPRPPAKGWRDTAATIRSEIARAVPWLPEIVATDGRVSWPGREIAVARVAWHGRELRASGSMAGLGPLALRLRPEADAGSIHLEAATDDGKYSASLSLAPAGVRGNLAVLGNPAEASATFGSTGWWPEQARVQGRNWRVSAAALGWDARYGTISGDFTAGWDAGHFNTAVTAAAEPQERNLPPLRVDVKAAGTRERVRVEQFVVQAPWAKATLDQPVEIDRNGRLVSGRSQFTVQADLAQQPWVPAAGRLTGSMEIAPGTDRIPQATFRLDATQLTWRDLAWPEARVAGTLAWPELRVTTLEVALGDDGNLGGHATINIRDRTVADGKVEIETHGGWIASHLPAGLAFAQLRGTAEFSGPWRALHHGGELRLVQATLPSLKPFAATAKWRGEGPRIASAEATMTFGGTELAASGGGGPDGARIDALVLRHGDGELWRLAAPGTIQWRPRLRIDHVALAGPAGRMAAQWTDAGGELKAELNAPALGWLDDVLVAKVPPGLVVGRADIDAGWDGKSPLQLTAAVSGNLPAGSGRTALVSIDLHTARDELVIDRIEALDGGKAVVRVQGSLPVSLQPGTRPMLQWAEDGRARLEAQTEPNPGFWQGIGDLTGLQVTDPAGTLHLDGTLSALRGELQFTAGAVAIDPRRLKFALPSMQQLRVRVTAAADAVQVDELGFQVEGQAVRGSGHLPLGRDAWRHLAQNPRAFDWRQATAELHVAQAKLAAFASYMPRLVAPQGELAADLAWRPGGDLGGTVRLTGLATRPVNGFGAVQDIAAELEFAGRRAVCRRLHGTIGGEPFDLEGWAELPPGGTPRADVSLHARNVPLTRQAGLVVHSDIDGRLVMDSDAPPKLTGKLRLRDSFYVASLRSLVPAGGPVGPQRRPPYFAIDQAPFDRWTLAVDVTGTRFMRIRTPLFRGVASAKLRLDGTLGDPRATGEAMIDEGSVQFPFATFAVQRGRVYLSPDDPHMPRLDVNATTQRLGYDLTMDLTGTAANPNLEFSSRPSLTSGQILLFVMAGETPGQDTTTNDQQRLAQLGAYLGRNLFTSFGGDPNAAGRLTVKSGEHTSQSGQGSLEVEYELDRRWSLVGENDEYNDYNVGLKWKVLGGRDHENEGK
ncbi:MAG TPA: translocation/assembly module TamB domain-containing protein [Lacunisphaera sp.]|nr:translocation/assembly module TamB domain-containing protein [Lacunisphaera sp.]